LKRSAGLWRERCEPRLPLPFQQFFQTVLLGLGLAALVIYLISKFGWLA
jgi:hypothetical protein